MERGLFNITDATEADLIPIYSTSGSVNSISLCNYHATDLAEMDVWIEDASGNKSYLLSGIKIPIGVTLTLKDDLSFNSKTLGLKAKSVNAIVAVSIIIK